MQLIPNQNFHEKFNKSFFLAKSCLFLMEGDVLKYYWWVRNQKNLKGSPLFWNQRINYKKYFICEPDFFLDYAYTKQIKEGKPLKKHLISRLKNEGMCHGECLAILEKVIQDPYLVPSKILEKVREDPTRVFYFQTLENIRATNLELQEKCLKLFPTHKEIEFPLSEIKEKLEILTNSQDSAFLIRYWNRSKKVAHSMLYIKIDPHYWFYSNSVGLFCHPTREILFEKFIEHLKRCFDCSFHSEIYLRLEDYELTSRHLIFQLI